MVLMGTNWQTFTSSLNPSLWPWPWTQQSNLFTKHSSLWCCTSKLNLVGQKQNKHTKNSSSDSRNNHILIIRALTVTTIAKNLSTRHWLMMMHHHTVWLQKGFLVQKISSGQTFNQAMNLHCDLDLDHSEAMFPQNSPAYDAVPSNKVW